MVSILVPHINEIKNPISSLLFKKNYDVTFSFEQFVLLVNFSQFHTLKT